ncbi:MAG: hypothetical protein HUJ54_03110 [Erysipelotrichaceae bacterium]|nr:hypothetical protein [Erysipelotrichaceae bacterium]
MNQNNSVESRLAEALNQASRQELMDAVLWIASQSENSCDEISRIVRFQLSGSLTKTRVSSPAEISSLLIRAERDEFQLSLADSLPGKAGSPAVFEWNDPGCRHSSLQDPAGVLNALFKIPESAASCENLSEAVSILDNLITVRIPFGEMEKGKRKNIRRFGFQEICIRTGRGKVWQESILLKSYLLFKQNPAEFREFVRHPLLFPQTVFDGFQPPLLFLNQNPGDSLWFQPYLQALFLEVCKTESRGSILARFAGPLLNKETLMHLRSSEIGRFARNNRYMNDAWNRAVRSTRW